ncbi:DUF3291 domain-containing protein [Sphingomonas oligophenolica]|uniref:DUF3291 domain-containing protein n=1 Tax=Sphingomonas oligophenolica TaxID=301154 RepID=A0ABU9Y5K6_9SPHN
MKTGWELAQINVGRMVAPATDPQVAGFFAELDRINALADASPGFVWRLVGDGNDATDLQPTPDPLVLVNMSVWEDAEALFAFVYRTAHTPVMAQRRQWFAPMEGAYQALWWIEAGTLPTVEDGLARLWLIDRFGPSARAFTFKSRFPAPGLPGLPIDMQPDPWCVGRA